MLSRAVFAVSTWVGRASRGCAPLRTGTQFHGSAAPKNEEESALTDIGQLNAQELPGKKLIGRNGADLGAVEEVYLDRATDRPEFALLKTGLLGRQQTLVPLAGASVDEVRVWVDLDRESVKDAPTVDPAEEIAGEQKDAIYRHYGIERPASGAPTEGEPTRDGMERPTSAAPTDGDPTRDGIERPASEAPTDGDPTRETTTPDQPVAAAPEDSRRDATASAERTDEMPRETPEHGRAPDAEPGEAPERERDGAEEPQPRLRRYMVTDEVEVKVPVRREEVSVEDPGREAEGESSGREPEGQPSGREAADQPSGREAEDQRSAREPGVQR